MKILIFSDIHGDLRALEKIVQQPADVYIAAGDLATFRRGLDKCGEILKQLGEKLWVLPGNHESYDETKSFCADFGFVDFHRKVLSLDTRSGPIFLAGLGYSNITPFDTPGEYTEEELATALQEFEGHQPLYLIIHVPPADTKLDEYAPGKHAGSPAVRQWVERVQPVELFCGHIHETAGMTDTLGVTRCFNVGKLGYILEL
jgi:Icc-related predicted phosphoesterase